jgi:ABC-type transport system substrate-binding protein
MKRRGLVIATPLAAGLAAAGASPCVAGPAPNGTKVFRYALNAAETGFDPARINDLYSRIVTAHIFEALFKYDYLARPYKIQPNTAAAAPDVSADFKTWTFRIKPGIFFSDDPAFGGRRRELVAQDYVYSWKRFYDPANNSPVYSACKEQGVLGVDALREQSLQTRKPFDYDREVEGVRALDRYTLQFRLERARPRLVQLFADNGLYGAVAREVVDAYGERIAEHPVGTGPFRLTSWRRNSLMVLERSPSFREVFYDAQPNEDDAAGQALLQRFRGRRLPMVDRVEVAVIEEAQPRWLSFLNREFDLAWPVPLDFADQAVPNGKLAPYLARRGVQMDRIVAPDRTLFYFNMDDPFVGGMAADRVALRRAIALATDVHREIALIRRHQAIPAQTVVAPGTYGYDPRYKSVNSDHDVARAKALLDLYGYVDRDGDGWREMPDGRPLTIEYASFPDATSRQFDESWKHNMDSVGIRLRIRSAQFPEQLKAARAGQLMVWQLGYSASQPDVQDALQLLYGPASGGQNLGRFKHARYDQLYERMQAQPDGPERLAMLDELLKIVTAYMPHKYNVHRILSDLFHPWVIGYRHALYGNQFWQYIDIDDGKRSAR